MKLSKNFDLNEFNCSEYAVRNNIDNTPGDNEISNLQLLCNNVLEPLRDLVERGIIINSGYRCPKLNKAIGGASNSQHQYGQAADIKVKGLSIEDLFQTIINSSLEYDQVINEFSQWIHISYNSGNNRKMKLRATKNDGKTIYTQI